MSVEDMTSGDFAFGYHPYPKEDGATQGAGSRQCLGERSPTKRLFPNPETKAGRPAMGEPDRADWKRENGAGK